MRKKPIFLLVAIFLSLFASGCNEPRFAGKTFTYFNAPITIQIDSRSMSKAELNTLFDGAESILSQISALTDPENNRSVTATFNALPAGGAILLDQTAEDLLKTALSCAELTDGYFNVLIAPLTDLWGFSPEKYNSETYVFTPPEEESILAVLPLLNSANLTLEQGTLKKTGSSATRIDLGGIAKGYALQKVREYLENNGIIYGIISGGNSSIELMKYKDNTKFQLGIRHPRKSADSTPIIVMETELAAASTSGDYERYYDYNGKRYSHLLNPFSGTPIDDGTMSVTVLGKNGAICDALSTGLCAMGHEKAKSFLKTECNDYTVFLIYTSGGENYIFTNAADRSFTVNDKSYIVETI